MAENSEDKESEKQNKSSKFVFTVLAIVLTIVFIAICCYIATLLKTPKGEEVQSKTPEIGIVRIREAVKAHKNYAQIEELHEKYEALTVDMMSLAEPVDIQLPELEKQAFDDSARQKLSQTIVDKIAVLEEKRRAAVNKYVKDTEADYEAKRTEIDSRYLNVIADLRMKLDNSDILHLSDEKIAELSNQLDALQHERGEAQDALKAQREQEIYNYGEQVVNNLKGEMASIDEEASKLMTEASLKESEVMERNTRLLEMGSNRMMAMREKEDELAKIKEDLRSLEEQVFSDVASLSAKYAAQNSLTFVISNVGVNIKSLLPTETPSKEERYSRVVVLKSLDITDYIINDLLIDENGVTK